MSEDTHLHEAALGKDPGTVLVTGNPDNHPDGDLDPVQAPTRPDGTPYRYEMLFAGMTRRAYADDPADLLDALVPGYTDGNHDQQWTNRLGLAARAQVLAQAVANEHAHFTRATATQRKILSGTRHEPVIVAHWDCPVPLVLIATDYQPAGKAPRPQPHAGMPPNIIWIDPSDEWTLLESLHNVGVIALHEAATN